MRNLSKDIRAHRPILILPSVAASFLERASAIDIPLTAKTSDFAEMLESMFGAQGLMEVFGSYAIVPVKGVISKGVSELDKMCGCCDIEDIEEMLEECERNDAVKTIILDIDSPGGTSVGVPELARRVRASSKKVIAFTESEAASAAYWIGSQASEFYATPSSSVGSIGCYIAYEDMSKAYADEGVTVDVIRSGKVKGAGIPGTSLTPEQRKMLQDEVSEIHADFKADVKAVREFVSDESMEGQTFSGKKAAEAGLVTALVNGFDELMESLDAAVAEQMENDEANDKRSAAAGEESEDSASARALRGISKSVLSRIVKKSMKVVITEDEDEGEEDEKEDGEEMKSEEAPEKEDPKAEEDGEKTPADEKKDGTAPTPSAEDDEEGEDGEAKSEEEEGDEKEDGKEDAEEEADASEKAVDTDEEHDADKTKRNKSRGIA